MLNFISGNDLKGISNFKKRRMIYTWCRSRKPDIIFLQETHSKKEIEFQWKNEWGGKMLFSHGRSNSYGTAILINKKYCKLHDYIHYFRSLGGIHYRKNSK